MGQKRIRVLFCDHLNLARGKYLHSGDKSTHSTRMCQGVYALTYGKDLISVPGGALLDGLHDMVLSYAADEIREGWQTSTRVVIADQFDTAGNALPMCGRGLLKRTIAQWRSAGLTPKVGIELEAFAFEYDENDVLKPYDTPGAYKYSCGAMTDPAGFTDAIWEKAAELGYGLESMSSEFDAPQFEFTLTHDDALAAVDTAFLFRQMAREIAFQHGIVLTFMPKPVADRSGSGVHVNFSFCDNKGHNIIADSNGEYGLSKIARACIAGLMFHHTALAGLIAPTVNSYQRLKPASLAGYWKNWGMDHRGVTTRVIKDSPMSAVLQHRTGDAGANPYTHVSAVLQAAWLGVENDYDLAPPESRDCLITQDAETGVARNLSAALRALEADKALRTAIGEILVGNHVGIKRAEIEEVRKLEGDDERDYYIHYL